MGTLALVQNEHACLRVSILFLLFEAKVLYKKMTHMLQRRQERA